MIDEDDIEEISGDTIGNKLAREANAWRRAKAERITAIETYLQLSPALAGMMSPGKPYESRRMAIVSGELSDTERGAFRVTFFGPDGPHGHATRRSMHEIAVEIEDTMSPPYESMSEDDVMAWTTTPEFETGSRIISYMQAENTLRYLAGRAGKTDWAYEVIRRVGEEAGPRPHTVAQIEHATEQITAALRTLPRQNGGRAGFVSNPPWVTGALANSYEALEKTLASHPQWMPQLSAVTSRGSTLMAKLTEFGCGKYGCVLPTSDPKIVLKVTTDDTEATFAADLAPTLVAPICVTYPMVAELDQEHQGDQIHLLWREAADHVGKVREQLGDYAESLVSDQHDAAKLAYDAVYKHRSETMIRARVSFWLEMCERMARQTKVPELRALGAGFVEVYEQQRILFGDVHVGNLGMVTRNGISSWVITDPGHVAVLDLE